MQLLFEDRVKNDFSHQNRGKKISNDSGEKFDILWCGLSEEYYSSEIAAPLYAQYKHTK
jgi:hypothetical protein